MDIDVDIDNDAKIQNSYFKALNLNPHNSLRYYYFGSELKPTLLLNKNIWKQ